MATLWQASLFSTIFPAAFAHILSLLYFGHFHNISNPPPAQRLQLTEGIDDGQQFLAIKYFLIKVCPFF